MRVWSDLHFLFNYDSLNSLSSSDEEHSKETLDFFSGVFIELNQSYHASQISSTWFTRFIQSEKNDVVIFSFFILLFAQSWLRSLIYTRHLWWWKVTLQQHRKWMNSEINFVFNQEWIWSESLQLECGKTFRCHIKWRWALSSRGRQCWSFEESYDMGIVFIN